MFITFFLSSTLYAFVNQVLNQNSIKLDLKLIKEYNILDYLRFDF